MKVRLYPVAPSPARLLRKVNGFEEEELIKGTPSSQREVKAALSKDVNWGAMTVFSFFFKAKYWYIYLFILKGNAIYLFIFGCVGSSFLCEGFV